jgi:hypothetical protein
MMNHANPTNTWVSDAADDLMDSPWTDAQLAGMLSRETGRDYAEVLDCGRSHACVYLAKQGIDLARFNFRKS